MTLTAALSTSRSSLLANGVQSSVLSRNIAGVNEVNYTRKIAVVSTLPGGGVYISAIKRASDNGLFQNVLRASSASAAQNVLYNGVSEISGSTVDDPELDRSPAAALSDLTNAIQQYTTAPDDITLAQALVTAATDLVRSLNESTSTVQSVRENADADMATSVGNINDLLSQFEMLNTTIVKGTISGNDITDYLDARDAILSSLSQEVGISVSVRANNDMVIYTDSGVTLFETKARTVSMQPAFAYTASSVGQSVYIDGVPVTGANAVMPIKSGQLAGLAKLRDDVTVTYQSQLDEVARTVIEIFAESDQSAIPALPDVPGLFTYGGAPAMPPTGVISVGLAGSISINPLADLTQGGDPRRVRDGGINGAAYDYNATDAAGFSARLNALIDGLAEDRTYDPLAQAKPNGSVLEFAGSSASWLEALRNQSYDNATYQQTLVERSAEALSNVNGVNMDDEMSRMLEIEKSYAASARLISIIDSMLQELLQAVR